MSAAPTALVIGEALIDIVRDGSEPTYLPGGSCANVAVALARLERPTVLATWYGDDEFGDLLEQHLTRSGVLVRRGSRHSGVRTSSAEATLGPDGSASYRFDVRWAFDPDVEPGRHSVVHVGSIGSQVAPGADGVEQAVQALRQTATVSYDVNARPALFGDPSEAATRAARLVASADLAKASDEDLSWLYPERSIAETADAWLELGAGAVLVTRGGSGASAFTAAGRADVERSPVQVVDTIGAGDTFSAAVIDALWSLNLLGSEKRDRLRQLPLGDWHRIIEYAGHAAGVVVARLGADPPYRHELPHRPLTGVI